MLLVPRVQLLPFRASRAGPAMSPPQVPAHPSRTVQPPPQAPAHPSRTVQPQIAGRRCFLLRLVASAALLTITGSSILSTPARAICPPTYDGQWSGFGNPPTGGPYGITVDEYGAVYTADTGRDFLGVYTPDGTRITEWGGHGTADGQFDGLITASVRDGFVYTIDNDRVQKFTDRGAWLQSFGTSGSGWGQLNDPRGIAVAGDGTILVADSGNNCIQSFSATGVFQGSWPVNQPYDIDISASGDLYVLGHDGIIHRYTKWGGLLASWGGGAFGPLSMPKGLDVDAAGNVYVADSFNDRMLVFGRNGEALIQWTHDFGYPRDVVRGLGDDIFVADTFHYRVLRFSANESGNCGPPPPPLPGGDQIGIALLLHVLPVPEALDCSQGVPANCVDARAQGRLSTPEGPFYYAYLLAKIDTLLIVAGAQCGISYQSGEPGDVQDGAGIDIFDWHLCATLQFSTPSPAWPEPGSGALLTWDPVNRCQTAQTAVAGWFYLAAYSPDVLQLTPHPIDGLAKLATCTSREGIVSPNRLGSAAFSVSGLVPGCNPCLVARCNEPVPVRQSTWSAIKTLIGGGS